MRGVGSECEARRPRLFPPDGLPGFALLPWTPPQCSTRATDHEPSTEAALRIAISTFPESGLCLRDVPLAAR